MVPCKAKDALFSPKWDTGTLMQDLKESGIGCIDTLNCLQISKGEELFPGAISFHLQRRAAGKIFLEVPAHYERTQPWISRPFIIDTACISCRFMTIGKNFSLILFPLFMLISSSGQQ